MNIGRLHAPSGLEVSSRGLFHDLIKNNIDNLFPDYKSIFVTEGLRELDH